MFEDERQNLQNALCCIAKETVCNRLKLGTEEGLKNYYAWYSSSHESYRAEMTMQYGDAGGHIHPMLKYDDFIIKLEEIFDSGTYDHLFTVKTDAANRDFGNTLGALIILRLIFKSPYFEDIYGAVRTDRPVESGNRAKPFNSETR